VPLDPLKRGAALDLASGTVATAWLEGEVDASGCPDHAVVGGVMSQSLRG
jgi:hypothetical protein